MTKTHKYIKPMLKYFILLLCTLHSCTHKNDKYIDIAKMYGLIDKYEPSEEYQYVTLQKSYPIGDSLNRLFEKLNPNEIINDTNYRKPILYLLEKKILYIINTATKKNIPYVYNASNWGGNDTYIQFALNIFSKIKVEKKYDYIRYNNNIRDIVCIDLIVSEAEKYNFVNEDQKKIHNVCVKFMPTKCSE